MGDPASVRILGNTATATVLHPIRRSMLEELRVADSASGLARKLGLARQKLNYHLRALEDAGLVELVEERKKGNCVERIVRATARSYLIDPAVAGIMSADPERIEDRFSAAYLVATASRLIRDLATVGEKARSAGKKVATFTLECDVRFRDAEDRNAFARELSTAAARLVTRFHDADAPGGRTFRFLIGGYPAPPHTNAERPGRTQPRDAIKKARKTRP